MSHLQRVLVKLIGVADAALESKGGVPVVAASRLDANGAPVFGPEQRGFYVMFTNRATIAEVLGGDSTSRAILAAGCGSMSISGRNGEPYGAIILIDMSRSNAAQSYCLNREMVENMGLPGYLPRTDSIFSDSAQVPYLSARDLALVRMLYDPRLRPGMTAAQARPVLQAVAADALAR